MPSASQSWRLHLRRSLHLHLSRGCSAADDRASPLAFAFRSVGDETNLARSNFAHWPVSNDILRGLVPPVLMLDTLGGQAWMAVTPFRISGMRAAGLPALPGLSRFPELNLRT